MSQSDRRRRGLRRLALICAVLMLAVTSLSAYMRLVRAGLGCSEWPACYGQQLQRVPQGGAAADEAQVATAGARLVHRLAASAVLLLVITMALICFASRPVFRREGRQVLLLLALALFLAVLGAWSSAARVPAVALGNLLGGFLMLALCVRLARPEGGCPANVPASLLAPVIVLLIAQVGLGGLTSASYAGLACTGWSDCGLGEVLRSTDWAALEPWREPVVQAGIGNPQGGLANSLHRHAAIVLTLAMLPVVVLVWRGGRPRAALALAGLLLGQVAIGLALGALALPLPLALLHNLFAAGLLSVLLSIA